MFFSGTLLLFPWPLYINNIYLLGFAIFPVFFFNVVYNCFGHHEVLILKVFTFMVSALDITLETHFTSVQYRNHLCFIISHLNPLTAAPRVGSEFPDQGSNLYPLQWVCRIRIWAFRTLLNTPSLLQSFGFHDLLCWHSLPSLCQGLRFLGHPA